MRGHVHVTFQDAERTALRALDVTGVEALLWGADFPHDNGSYPYSRETVEEIMSEAKIGPEDRASILGGTLAKLYDVELPVG